MQPNAFSIPPAPTTPPQPFERLMVTVGGQELYRNTVYYWQPPKEVLKAFDDALQSVLDYIGAAESLDTEQIQKLRLEYNGLCTQLNRYEQAKTSDDEYRQLFKDESNQFDARRRREEARKERLNSALAARKQPRS